MKIKIKVTETRTETVTKEIELPYYVKRILIDDYVCIMTENKVVSVYSGPNHNEITLDTGKRDMSDYFGDDFEPITAEEFNAAMDKTVRTINVDLADFVGIETSLLP